MNAFEQALYNKLIGDGTLTALLGEGTASIFNAVIPHSATLPVVVFFQQASPLETEDPHHRENFLYMVKVVSSHSMASAGTISERVDTLLHNPGTALVVSGHTVFWQMRTEGARYVEVDDRAKNFYHSGATYRIRMSRN